MSDQDEPKDSSNSLLRRILSQDQPPAPNQEIPPDQYSPLDQGRASRPRTVPPGDDKPPTSPIRPHVEDDSQPQPPLTPTPPGAPPSRPLTPREQMQRAEEALINLRQKMSRLAAEFAEGKLNQAQFDAIYSRYSEQRMITELLLDRNPESQAWQSVVRPGHTQFLKDYYEARVLSYGIYDQQTFDLVSLTGGMRVAPAQTEAALRRLKEVSQARGNPGPAQRRIGDGRCVLFVPGEWTVAVVIFSLDPSTVQVRRIQDLHQDFERANQHALQSRDYAAERLVFPHRALFEEQRNR